MKRLAAALLASTAIALQPAYGQVAADSGKANPLPTSGLSACYLSSAPGLCAYKTGVGLVSVPIAVVQVPAFGGDIACAANQAGVTSVICAVNKIGGKAPADVATSGSASDLKTGTLAAAYGGTDIPVVPGLSQSTNTSTCTTVAPGSGLALCPAGHDFQTGQGVLVPAQGAAFPSFGAPTITATPVGNTGSDTTKRCYVLVPLDGVQGYGSPSAEGCTGANAPATPAPGDYVKVTWTNGSSPPPSYAMYEGPSGGPYAIRDYFGNGGLGWEYGRATPKQEFWLPQSIAAGASAQKDAIHGIATVTGNYIDVGLGFSVPAGTSVTLYHDNALPIRYALANEAAGQCVRIPIGVFPTSATSFGGSTLTSTGQCLAGSDRLGTKLQLITGVVGAPFFAQSGAAPSWKRMSIDGNGFNSDQSGLLSLSGATGPIQEDFALLNVAKNAVSNAGSVDAVFRRFSGSGTADYANQGTFLHDVHNTNTKVEDFSLTGFGFDMADAGCEIRNGRISGFISAGIGTEQDPFASACRMHHNVLAPAPSTVQDINITLTECIESWAPDDAIENNTCINPVGSAYSIGGLRSRVIGNAASTALANPNAAFAMRLDSPTYYPAGAVVMGNTDVGPFAYGMSEFGTAATCGGCLFGLNGFAGTTAAINTGSLQGGEKFMATATTPQ